MAIPTMRPTIAPMHSDGMYNPAGTLMPMVKMVIITLNTKARHNKAKAVYTPDPAAALSMTPLTLV